MRTSIAMATFNGERFLPAGTVLQMRVTTKDSIGKYASFLIKARSAPVRSDLCVMWLEHLLLLSMLQHASGTYSWGRYVVVHPAGNTDIVEVCARYRGLLAEESTFASVTLEDLLEAQVLQGQRVVRAPQRGANGEHENRHGGRATHRAMVAQPKFKAKSLDINGLVSFRNAFGTMPLDGRTEDRSATGARRLPPRH